VFQLSSVAALGLACNGGSLVVAEQLASGDLEPTELADAGDAAPPPDVAIFQNCPPSPIDRQAVRGCWPTKHLGRFRGFFIGTPRYQRLDGSSEEFPTGGIELSLFEDGSGQLTFGAAGTPGDREPCTGLDTPDCALVGRMRPGFEYDLNELALYDPEDEPSRIAGAAPLRKAETLTFVVWLGEPWAAWCAQQVVPKGACPSNECGNTPGEKDPATPVESRSGESSSCGCGEQGCRPGATSLSFSLRMSQNHHALRGVYMPEDRRLGEAHLELERQEEP
jgi:hypothetical protein